MVTMGEAMPLSMERSSAVRSSRSSSSRVRGMSPTSASWSKPAAEATTVASTMPTSEPGTRAPHFLGQNTITATTSAPMSTGCHWG